MKFCPNCGTPVNGQGKFCSSCGFKLNPEPVVPVQEAPVAPPPPPAPPVQTYAPAAPVQEEPVAPPPPPAPPVQTYAPAAPVQEEPVAPPPPPAPPMQTYAPAAPVQEEPVAPPPPPAPPVQTYAPAAPVQEEPVAPPPPPPAPPMPPVQNLAYSQQPSAPQKPAAKKKSKLPLFIGLGVAVIVIAVLAILFVPKLFGGANVEGVYEGVSVSMMGMEMSGDMLESMGGMQMELKEDNECVLDLFGETVTGTWELDGEDITFEMEDDVTAEGTLVEGTLTMAISEDDVEMDLVFEKKDEDGKDDKDDKDDKDNKDDEDDEDDEDAKPEPEPEPEISPVGEYNCTRLFMLDMELTGDLLKSAGETWLDIKDDGTVILMLMDDSIGGTYTVDGEEITFDLEGITANGTWDGTNVTLSIYVEEIQMEMDFTMGEIETTGGGEEPIETVSGYDWWAGDWYGWWIVTDGTGQYEEWIDIFWDTCANIEVYGDTGYITIWDQDTSYTECLADAEIEFSEGFSEHGSLISVAGYFMDCEMSYYDWFVDSDGDEVSIFEDMICITGTYYDPASNDYFDYSMYLRPWGMLWDDVEMGHEEAPYNDMMPALYYDWYLPLIEAGATEAPADFN